MTKRDQPFVANSYHYTCKSWPRLRDLKSPKKKMLSVGKLMAIDWEFQESLMNFRVTSAFSILIFRGLLTLSIMFLIVLLHSRMSFASKVEYNRR